ncbi:MAG: GNAT family N-acetyltransferase [Anaerolineae bacterium]|nr:GNAT family N-acetyltransferase [Anaerolineae bacterium]
MANDNLEFVYPIDKDIELCVPDEYDVEEVHALVMESLPQLKPWLPWASEDHSLEDASNYIEQNFRRFASGQAFAAHLMFRGQIAGSIGYNTISWEDRKGEIGYWLGTPFQGRGLMTKACGAWIDHAFNQINLNRIEIRCAVDNHRSRKIPKRLGFKEEGVLRQAEWVHDHFHDLVLYSLLASEWQTINGSAM